MDKNYFKGIITGLSECFNKPVSADLLRLYWRKLGHLDQQKLVDAVDLCVDECKYFPRVSEILERVTQDKLLENKGSLSWCDNTQKLLNDYAN